jgi:hypothetical protein
MRIRLLDRHQGQAPWLAQQDARHRDFLPETPGRVAA